jgi:CRP-like cAMP-binding protein
MRKVTLWKGAALWEAGDTARTIAVLEKGTLGIRVGDELVGVASGRTVLGESAIFRLRGEELKRTAGLFALEDDTQVTEYPADRVKQAIDGAQDQVGPLILRTLVSQACRNLLIVVTLHRSRPLVEGPLKALMQALIERGREVDKIGTWDDFMISFRLLHDLRDYSQHLREELGGQAKQAEASVKASDVVRDLFKGDDVAAYLEGLIAEERETDKWLDRGRA